MEIYCLADMIGTKGQFLNLFYGLIGIFIFLGIAIFISDRSTKNNN